MSEKVGGKYQGTTIHYTKYYGSDMSWVLRRNINEIPNLGLERTRKGFTEEVFRKLSPQLVRSIGQEWRRKAEAEGSTNAEV